MKQRLCIGISNLTETWVASLNRMGLWFEEIDFDELQPTNYSLLIVNSKLENSEISLVQEYVHSGGLALECGFLNHFLSKKDFKKVFISSLPVSSQEFNRITHLDLFSKCLLSQKSDYFEGLLSFHELGEGCIAKLGIEFESLIDNIQYQRKRFYSKANFRPDEIVSKIDKNQLLLLLELILQKLTIKINLPFVRKWLFPNKKPVFLFRIDSDYGNAESIDELYHLAEKHDLKFSWFLHVKAHEDWLEKFRTFKNQEIAVHGYEHGYSEDTNKSYENIKTGLKLLKQNRINSNGYCAPYGIYNPALRECLHSFNFLYSSEFTLIHDGFPMRFNNQLQVPIHPICTGSLSRIGASSKDMIHYFEELVKENTKKFEPLALYHHPMQKGMEVIDEILTKIKKMSYENLTFQEFAEFWNIRDQSKFQAFYNPKTKVLEFSKCDGEINWLQISTNENQFGLISFKNAEINLGKSDLKEFSYQEPSKPDGLELKTLRNYNSRLIRTSLRDWKNRKKL